MTIIAMDRRKHSLDTYALLQAAITGDEEGVREALKAGADVNAVDARGRTALTSAITGDSWQTINTSDALFMSESRLNVLKLLVGRQDISLYILNAPQECMSSVCPLGMCAWLNMPRAVEVLLECSAGRMSVDGTDSLGATPLMYAARDGNLAVVKLLLDHGARPDFRDMNHRTAIQYALRHSEVLRMCEESLRRIRRCQNPQVDKYIEGTLPTAPNDETIAHRPAIFPRLDSSPTSIFPVFTRQAAPSVTDQLIYAIVSSDLTFLHSLLCLLPTSNSSQLSLFVNKPDRNGWSPIHHSVAVKRPSTEAVDALYNAGADVSLFTTSEYYTPLHCLARREHASTHTLYLFTVHLVRNLHAPLDAKDRRDETCIHIAAEHGKSIDILMAFLDCDESCAVRNSRNSRGLTALEVAKPQFRPAFGTERPESSVSVRTIRPSMSLVSLPPLHDPKSSIESTCDAPLSPPSLADFDVASCSNSLLDNLGFISAELSHHKQSTRLDAIQDLLKKTRQTSRDILSHFRTQVDEARKELGEAKATFGRVDGLWGIVSHAAEARLKNGRAADEGLLLELINARRLTRDSADSQATAVSDSCPVFHPEPPSLRLDSVHELETYVTVAQYKDASIATEPPLLNITVPLTTIKSARPGLWPEWFDSLIPSPDSTPHVHRFGNLDHAGHDVFGRPRKQSSRPSTPRKDSLKSILTGRRKEEIWPQMSDEEKLGKSGLDAASKSVARSSSAKFRTWLKSKIVFDHRPLKFEIAIDIDEERCPVGREVKATSEAGIPQKLSDKRSSQESDPSAKVPLDPIFRGHLVALVAASRDLGSIEDCMTTAEQFIATAYRSISRAERISQRALWVRERALQNLRIRSAQGSAPPTPESPTFLRIPDSHQSDSSGYPCSPPSSAVSSIYSSKQPSSTSLTSTMTDTDDEDTRALRGLLLRKIGTRVDGSFEEIDKITMWLRIVREVVRGVKCRAGL